MSDAKGANADPAAKAEAGAAAPKSSKKLIIIIAAAVVLLGGGAGAYFMLGSKGEEGAEGEKHAEKAEAKLPAQFVAMEDPFVVNFEAGASARFLQIVVQLMTRDPHMVEFLEHNSPIIRNDLLLLFSSKRVEDVSTNEGKEALRQAALETVRAIIAHEGEHADALEAVYFTSFVMQ